MKRGILEFIQKAIPIRSFFKKNSYAVDELKLKEIENIEHAIIRKEKTTFDVIIIFTSIALLLIFLFWLGLQTESSMFLVFVGFSPTIIYLILTIYLLEKSITNKPIIWLTPVFLGIIFNIVGNNSGITIFKQMQIYELTVLNILVAFSFAAILSFVGVFDSVKERYKKQVASLKSEKKELQEQIIAFNEAGRVNDKNIGEYIQGIEDKCKAINFVIGRVYSNRNGGNKHLRDRLKITPSWYNEFSKLSEDFNEEKRESANKLINMILDRLNQYWNKESTMFEMECYAFKNLVRSENCSDRIIDVLINNDNDPIRIYFESAVDYCLKIKEYLEA